MCFSGVTPVVLHAQPAPGSEPAGAHDTAAGRAAPVASPGPTRDPVTPPRGPNDRRPLPDYDGRPESTSFGAAVAWVPRVLLFPAYVVSEYALRRPLGWLVSTAELEHWPTLVLDFFTFRDRQIGLLPVFLVDVGLRPSVGVYGFWNDFLVSRNELRLRASYGGSYTYQLRVTDRFPLGAGTLSVTGLHDARSDFVFRGVGPDAVGPRSRYFQSLTAARVRYRLPWVRTSHVDAELGLRELELDGSRGCCDEPTVDERVLARGVLAPAGMNQIYDVLDQEVRVVLDSRFPRNPESGELATDYVAPPGTGVRVALRASASELLERSLGAAVALASGWVHYGASLGGYVDLTGQQRAISVTAVLDFVDPIGRGEVPLSDLVSLGGDRPLRGYLPRQFVDRSAAALRLEYTWPVAVWLDGNLVYEVGNVFGRGLTGFALEKLRSSVGLGLASVGVSDQPFQALIALGTQQYEEGGRVDSVRFVFGTTSGF